MAKIPLYKDRTDLQEFRGQTFDAKPVMDLAAAEEKRENDLLQGVFKVGQEGIKNIPRRKNKS